MPKRPLYRWTEEWADAADRERDRLANMTMREVAEERQSAAVLIDELATDVAIERQGAGIDVDEDDPAWIAMKSKIADQLVRHVIATSRAQIAARARVLIDDLADDIVAEKERERREHVPDIVWDWVRPMPA